MDFTSLLSAVPAEWLVYVAVALKALAAFTGFSSWVAPLVKKYLGANSVAAHVADYAAVTSRKASDSTLIADLKARVADLEKSGLLKDEALKASDETIRRQAATIRSTFKVSQ